MALIKRLEKMDIAPRKKSHQECKASYSIYERDGKKFMQIVSYGHGRNPNKISQTTQFDQDSAFELFNILKRAFNFQ